MFASTAPASVKANDSHATQLSFHRPRVVGEGTLGRDTGLATDHCSADAGLVEAIIFFWASFCCQWA